MTIDRIAKLLLWGAVTALLSVQLRAGQPGAVLTTAEVWLDRAQTEIAALPDDPPRGMVFAHPGAVALDLYLTVPTEQRRLLALQLVDRELQSKLAKKKSAEETEMLHADSAMDHALLGDAEGARQQLAVAHAQSGGQPTTDPAVRLLVQIHYPDQVEGEADLLLGDRPSFLRLGLPLSAASLIGDDLLATGHPAEAQSALDYVTDPANSSHAGLYDPAQIRDPVRRLVAEKKWADALAIVDKSVPMNEGDPHVRLSGYHAIEAYAIIADAALDVGATDTYRLAVKAATALLRAHPKELSLDDEGLLRVCVRVGDRTAFDVAATIGRQEIEAERKSRDHYSASDVWPLAKLARWYAAIGDMANYQTAVDECERDLGLPIAAAASADEKARDERSRAGEYLLVGAARARAGDSAGEHRDTELSIETVKLTDDQWDEGWSTVIHAYADAGLFDRAVAALVRARDDDYGLFPAYIARREAAAGKWDEAWKLAASVPNLERIRLDYVLAVGEVKAGKESELLGRVDALKTPQERAMVDLATAQALLGREYFGQCRTFRTRDD
jgi:hypothetical protein